MMGSEKAQPFSLRRAAELCAQEFEITIRDAEGTELGSEKIWLRTQTHQEFLEAQSAGAKYRLDLKRRYAVGTADYDFITSELEYVGIELLANLVLMGERADIGVRAAQGVPRPMPIDPDKHKTADEREKAEEDAEKRQQEYQKKTEAIVEEALEKRRIELCALAREQLAEMAVRPMIRQRIENEIAIYLAAYRIFDCCREPGDHSKHYFPTLDAVMESPENIQAALLQAIQEVDRIQPVDIKNSQGRSVLRSGSAESIPEATEAPTTSGSSVSPGPKKKSPGGRKRSSNG